MILILYLLKSAVVMSYPLGSNRMVVLDFHDFVVRNSEFLTLEWFNEWIIKLENVIK